MMRRCRSFIFSTTRVYVLGFKEAFLVVKIKEELFNDQVVNSMKIAS